MSVTGYQQHGNRCQIDGRTNDFRALDIPVAAVAEETVE
jgi:hypothetical protein